MYAGYAHFVEDQRRPAPSHTHLVTSDTPLCVIRLTGQREPGATVNTRTGMLNVWLWIFNETWNQILIKTLCLDPTLVYWLRVLETHNAVYTRPSAQLTGLHNISVILLFTKLPFPRISLIGCTVGVGCLSDILQILTHQNWQMHSIVQSGLYFNSQFPISNFQFLIINFQSSIPNRQIPSSEFFWLIQILFWNKE